jgi:MtfA peptidase
VGRRTLDAPDAQRSIGAIDLAMRGWLKRWRDTRTLERRAIPDQLWRLTLSRFPFLSWRSAADVERLRDMTTLFLADKEFTGAHRMRVDDEMAVAVAAQACLPALELGLHWYAGFKGIVMHPDAVLAQREFVDDAGVVHEYDEELAGEAMHGGPVMLAWRDVDEAGESAETGYNVVIHEFAHVIDMRDGAPDGVPPLPDRAAREAWASCLSREYAAFCERVDEGRYTLLDPYAAEAPEEFFAVASEAFFVAPKEFAAHHPEFYALLRGFFKQDPLRYC